MSDTCFAPKLMPFDIALTSLLDGVHCTRETKTLSLEDSIDHVLAEDVVSKVNVPPHDNSAMDGFAFHSSSFSDNPNQSLTLVGKAMAGRPFSRRVETGECVRIMTGAKIPTGCDTVVMQENTKIVEHQVTVNAIPKVGNNIRLQGEDIHQNTVLMRQGDKIRPVDIGLLASLGVPTVNVYRPVKVAVLSTGDELKPPGQALAEGEIYESNRPVLKALLSRLNCQVIDFGIIKDDKQELEQTFKLAAHQADVVISTGGVSVGEADYTKDILAKLGHIEFWKIAMKPGKPFAFGHLTDSVFFGLPGNPVSTMVTFMLLVVPGLAKMQGQSMTLSPFIKAKVGKKIPKSGYRMEFMRAILSSNEQGQAVVNRTDNQGSGVLTSMAIANCFIKVPANSDEFNIGDWVDVLPFDGGLF
ncbi:gephyrin-like molybdotransferase Glp [Thalassotalea aquiviva]|uniref:molybdopterin molybdotransferase MoeA n=1 Tax=Thalassotalea aquiviva TaxID=3242415 RepID=UPI003529FCAD